MNILTSVRRPPCAVSYPVCSVFSSAASHNSDYKMRLTSLLRGQHFGNLYKINGLVTYKISPFEQRAFAGAISKGVPNMFRRFRSNVFIVTPPFIIGYLVYDLAEKEHARLLRKDPAEFANDE